MSLPASARKDLCKWTANTWQKFIILLFVRFCLNVNRGFQTNERTLELDSGLAICLKYRSWLAECYTERACNDVSIRPRLVVDEGVISGSIKWRPFVCCCCCSFSFSCVVRPVAIASDDKMRWKLALDKSQRASWLPGSSLHHKRVARCQYLIMSWDCSRRAPTQARDREWIRARQEYFGFIKQA